MRPVTKLPVNSVAVQAKYTIPTNFSFINSTSQALQTHVRAKFGNLNPTTGQCLRELQRISLKAKGNRTADEKAYKKAMNKMVADVYKKAGDPLAWFIGEYCSYCETRITGLGEVEHIRPKSTLNTFALDWDNFLLSCGPCNNAKSNKPSKADVEALTGQTATDTQYAAAIRNYYVWPDTDAKSYRWIEYTLKEVNIAGNGTNDLSTDEQFSLSHANVVINQVDRTVTADIFDPDPNVNAATNRSVRVIATGTGGASAKQPNADAAQRSIDLMQINELRSDRNVYDSRMLKKTECWFDALSSVYRIDALTQPLPQFVYDN